MNPFDKHQSPEHIAKRVESRKKNGWWKDINKVREVHRKAMEGTIGLKGPDNPMWRGGLSKLPQGYRSSFEYKEWRSEVMERDNSTCQKCGSTKNVIAHHKIGWHMDKSLRIDVSNGIALCRKCHFVVENLLEKLHPGVIPNNPFITNIVCKYCGKIKSVRTSQRKNYSTCGSTECRNKKLREATKDTPQDGVNNGNYKNGDYTNEFKICESCSKEFFGLAKNKYCSLECSDKGRSTTRMTLHCRICSKEFVGQPYNKFCSRDCYYKSRQK